MMARTVYLLALHTILVGVLLSDLSHAEKTSPHSPTHPASKTPMTSKTPVTSKTPMTSKTPVTSTTPMTSKTTMTPPTTSASVSANHTAKPVNYTKEVCYSRVGCFNNLPPFDNANLALPASPDHVGTHLLLFTRTENATDQAHTIDYTNMTSLQATTFNPSKPTKIIIHGFANDINTMWLYEMKDELLQNADMNVIIVTWGPGAAFPNYIQAVANTRIVAEQTRQLVLNMVNILGVSPAHLHLIGHSLGAHISGHVGFTLKKENITLTRISGMDPAEPDFQDHPKSIRLDKGDADYVDVIHTNGAPFSSGGAGMFEPCGHVDFYVNGGETQPDCPSQVSSVISHIGDLFSGKTEEMATEVSCSHSRSHEVYMESINSKQCQFTAYPCDGYEKFQNGECLSCGEEGCGMMGYDSNFYYATGMLFLNTRRSLPHCGHHYNVGVDIATSTNGRIMVQLNGTWGHSEWMDVTRDDSQSLSKDSHISRVVAAGEIVGKVESMNVQYIKGKGNFLGLGKGRDTIQLKQVHVESGENGLRFTFCPVEVLQSSVAQTLLVAHGHDCTKH